MEEIFRKIAAHIESKAEIDQAKFHEITPVRSMKTIAFIDGGNLEIIRSPSLSVFFNRVYQTTYKNNKRTVSERKEFYTLITAAQNNGKDRFHAQTYGDIELSREFEIYDNTLTSYNHAAEISAVGNVMRRLIELKAAGEAKTDFAIIDGSLEEKYTHEKEFLGNVKYGLSKTNRELFQGNTYSSMLDTKINTWYFDAGKFCFIKLHPKSKYIFKFEAKGTTENFLELLGLLRENSKDPIFLGYPYGLIEADRFARVSDEEKKILEIRFKARLGKNIEPYLNSLNAHDLL